MKSSVNLQSHAHFVHGRSRIMAIDRYRLRFFTPLALALVGALPLPAAAQSPGFGRELATRWCMGCHVIEREPRSATADGVPSFPAIAAKPNTTAASIEQYLSTGHTRMPDFSLSRSESNALVAYILSFR
jgi:mono/diheme cytochrome c family protein